MRAVDPCGLKRAALINDLSCFGKCSLSVSMPILSAYGVETVPLPTAILSTHTGGFTGFVVQDMTENMRLFAAHWKKLGVKFDAIITSVGSGNRIGYLARLDGRVTCVQKPVVDMTLHGAGDVFTSALCGELLSGQAPQNALLHAADFCDSCIHETAKRQPGHWYGLAFEPVLKGNRV